MMSLLHSPRATRSNASAILLWCAPDIKVGHTRSTNLMNLFWQSSLSLSFSRRISWASIVLRSLSVSFPLAISVSRSLSDGSGVLEAVLFIFFVGHTATFGGRITLFFAHRALDRPVLEPFFVFFGFFRGVFHRFWRTKLQIEVV